jgi:hypothetical protein
MVRTPKKPKNDGNVALIVAARDLLADVERAAGAGWLMNVSTGRRLPSGSRSAALPHNEKVPKNLTGATYIYEELLHISNQD